MLNKLQLQNLLNFKFKILTNPCAKSLNKSLALGPNVSFQICNKLLPTRSSSSTSATVTTSISFELASAHTRITSIKFTKRQSVSQWVSEWVSDKHNQWSDSGPIKTRKIVLIDCQITRVFKLWQHKLSFQRLAYKTVLKFCFRWLTNYLLSSQSLSESESQLYSWRRIISLSKQVQ